MTNDLSSGQGKCAGKVNSGGRCKTNVLFLAVVINKQSRI
jgi:hypothetical protein